MFPKHTAKYEACAPHPYGMPISEWHSTKYEACAPHPYGMPISEWHSTKYEACAPHPHGMPISEWDSTMYEACAPHPHGMPIDSFPFLNTVDVYKSLEVILAVLGACQGAPSLVDTPAVAAAKIQFFQAYQAAAAAAAAAPGSYTQQATPAQPAHGGHSTQWIGPFAHAYPASVNPAQYQATHAAQQVAPIGPAWQPHTPHQGIADTPDVAAAKAQHFAAYHLASAGPRWTGPMAATVPASVNPTAWAPAHGHGGHVNNFVGQAQFGKWTGPQA